jgi:NADH-quinone oxidoreductase subunit G
VFDDSAAEQALRKTKAMIIVQDMFLTATAELADVVLPTQSAGEREGTYTSGERRVQRFYPAVEPVGASQPDWHIVGLIAEGLGNGPPPVSTAALMLEISETVPHYADTTYQALAKVIKQWPDVGGEDLYYGGTSFQNFRGIGIQWPTGAEAEGASIDRVPAPAGDAVQNGEAVLTGRTAEPFSTSGGEGRMVVVPVTLIYDAEPVVFKTGLLHGRIPVPHVGLNPADADGLGAEHGDMLSVTLGGREIMAAAYLDGGIPAGVATMPRRLQPQGAPLAVATATIKKAEKVEV